MWYIYIHIIIIISIQPEGQFWQEPEPSQATGMALARCILGSFLGVGCHCFPPPLDVPTFAARRLHVQATWETSISERRNNGREMAGQFCLWFRLPRKPRVLWHAAQICGMGEKKSRNRVCLVKSLDPQLVKKALHDLPKPQCHWCVHNIPPLVPIISHISSSQTLFLFVSILSLFGLPHDHLSTFLSSITFDQWKPIYYYHYLHILFRLNIPYFPWSSYFPYSYQYGSQYVFWRSFFILTISMSLPS